MRKSNLEVEVETTETTTQQLREDGVNPQETTSSKPNDVKVEQPKHTGFLLRYLEGGENITAVLELLKTKEYKDDTNSDAGVVGTPILEIDIVGKRYVWLNKDDATRFTLLVDLEKKFNGVLACINAGEVIPSEVEQTATEMFEEWFNEEGNKRMLSETADAFRLKFSDKNGGWFDLIQVTRFTQFKAVEDALQVLNLLKLGGLLVATMKGKKEVYKITMTTEARLKVVQSELKRLRGEVSTLEQTEAKLKTEIESNQEIVV